MAFRYRYFVLVITGLAAVVGVGLVAFLRTNSADNGELIGFWVSAVFASALSASLIGGAISKLHRRRWLAIACGALVPLLAYPLVAPIFALTQAFVLGTLPGSAAQDLAAYMGIGALVYFIAGIIYTGWIAIPLCIAVAALATRPSKGGD